MYYTRSVYNILYWLDIILWDKTMIITLEVIMLCMYM